MKLSILKFALLSFFVTTVSLAQSTDTFFTKADAFFSAHVSNGKVDYKTIKNDPSSLNELLAIAERIEVSTSNARAYQAFWINAYNLSVIKGIVTNYPIKSPLDKKGFFDKVTYSIGGTSTTLNDIENKLLRAKFPQEARFHFVLVCAGLGCPPIIGSAYMPNTLDAQLEKQTKLALNNPKFIRVNKNKVGISQIFEWYTKDFTQDGKSLVDYINQYRKEPLPEKAKISYYAYDWTLNASK